MLRGVLALLCCAVASGGNVHNDSAFCRAFPVMCPHLAKEPPIAKPTAAPTPTTAAPTPPLDERPWDRPGARSCALVRFFGLPLDGALAGLGDLRLRARTGRREAVQMKGNSMRSRRFQLPRYEQHARGGSEAAVTFSLYWSAGRGAWVLARSQQQQQRGGAGADADDDVVDAGAQGSSGVPLLLGKGAGPDGRTALLPGPQHVAKGGWQLFWSKAFGGAGTVQRVRGVRCECVTATHAPTPVPPTPHPSPAPTPSPTPSPSRSPTPVPPTPAPTPVRRPIGCEGVRVTVTVHGGEGHRASAAMAAAAAAAAARWQACAGTYLWQPQRAAAGGRAVYRQLLSPAASAGESGRKRRATPLCSIGYKSDPAAAGGGMGGMGGMGGGGGVGAWGWTIGRGEPRLAAGAPFLVLPSTAARVGDTKWGAGAALAAIGWDGARGGGGGAGGSGIGEGAHLSSSLQPPSVRLHCFAAHKARPTPAPTPAPTPVPRSSRAPVSLPGLQELLQQQAGKLRRSRRAEATAAADAARRAAAARHKSWAQALAGAAVVLAMVGAAVAWRRHARRLANPAARQLSYGEGAGLLGGGEGGGAGGSFTSAEMEGFRVSVGRPVMLPRLTAVPRAGSQLVFSPVPDSY